MPERTEHSEQEHLSTQEVLKKYNDLQDQQQNLRPSIEDAFEPHSEEIEASMAVLETELGRELTIKEADVLVHDMLKEKLSPEDFTAIKLDDYLDLRDKIDQLDATYTDRVTGLVAQRLQAVSETANWDSVVEQIADSSTTGLSNKWRTAVINLAHDDHPANISQATYSLQAIDKFATELTADNLVLPEPAPAKEQFLPQAQIVSALDYLKELTLGVESTYLGGSRKGWRMSNVPMLDIELNVLTETLKTVDERGGSLSPQALDAFTRGVVGRINDFTTREFAHNVANRETAANALFVGRKDLFEKATGGNATEWIEQHLADFPDRFTKGLGFVYFTEKIESAHTVVAEPEEDITDNPQKARGQHWEGMITTGVTHPRENSITISTGGLKEGKSYNANILSRTFNHELGHYIHINVLSIPELRDWQVVLDSDPRPIDDYTNSVLEDVKEAIDPDLKKLHEQRLASEQFAATIEEYKTDHIRLAVVFPGRFEYFNNLFGKYDKEQVAAQIEDIRNRMAQRVAEQNAATEQATQSAAPQSDSTETP